MNDMQLVEFFTERQPIYRADPLRYWAEVIPSYKPDPAFVRATYDLVEHDRISIRSGQGVGKTAFEAAVILWFLPCFYNSRIVATAPTRQQLHDVLWAEIAKWIDSSPLLRAILSWSKTRISVKGEERQWFGVAKTANRPENMQGFHADNMLFVVDEASGVLDPILEAIQGTLSGSNNKWLLCGNPNKAYGVFHKSYTSNRAFFCVHRISARESPRTNKDNIAALEADYGKDSNVVRVRVDGEPPLQDDDVFIPIALLEAAVNTEPKAGPIESIHIGCDVARFGDDRTCIGYMVNEQMKFYKKITGQDTMRTAADIVMLGEELIRKHNYTRAIPVKIDDGGVGGGVVDRLRQIKQSDPARFRWLEVFPVAFGRPIKHPHYYDTTTAMMGIVKRLLAPHDEEGNPKPVELIIPNDNDLIGQLSCRKYTINERSKTVVESKKAMKDRGTRSPDEADCLLLCCLPVTIKNERGRSIEREAKAGYTGTYY